MRAHEPSDSLHPIACFNAKTGDVEDAPALDALTAFKVVEKDGAVYVRGEAAAIKSGRRKPSIKCRVNSSSKADKVVVVGGGSGAIGAVEALRAGGFSAPITVITKEGYLPIDRTKLSKALLTDVNKAQWRDAEFFKSGSIDFVEDEVSRGWSPLYPLLTCLKSTGCLIRGFLRLLIPQTLETLSIFYHE